MKSSARTWPASFANSPVNRPIPAPNSKTDFPLNGGSRERTYKQITTLSLHIKEFGMLQTTSHVQQRAKNNADREKNVSGLAIPFQTFFFHCLINKTFFFHSFPCQDYLRS